MPSFFGYLAPLWVLTPVVFVVGGWTAVIWSIRRWQRRSGVSASVTQAGKPDDAGSPLMVVRGSARVGSLNATWPLAVLSFNESFAELRVMMLHPIYISRTEVIRVTKRRWSTQLRFETVSGRLDRVAFGGSAVGTALRERGWPVE